jgi:hypothetical protein
MSTLSGQEQRIVISFGPGKRPLLWSATLNHPSDSLPFNSTMRKKICSMHSVFIQFQDIFSRKPTITSTMHTLLPAIKAVFFSFVHQSIRQNQPAHVSVHTTRGLCNHLNAKVF